MVLFRQCKALGEGVVEQLLHFARVVFLQARQLLSHLSLLVADFRHPRAQRALVAADCSHLPARFTLEFA